MCTICRAPQHRINLSPRLFLLSLTPKEMISEWNFSTNLPCSLNYRIVISDCRTEYTLTNVQKLRLHPGTGKAVASSHIRIPARPLRVVSSRGITWSWSEMHVRSQARSHAGFPSSESVLPQDPLVTSVATVVGALHRPVPL